MKRVRPQENRVSENLHFHQHPCPSSSSSSLSFFENRTFFLLGFDPASVLEDSSLSISAYAVSLGRRHPLSSSSSSRREKKRDEEVREDEEREATRDEGTGEKKKKEKEKEDFEAVLSLAGDLLEDVKNRRIRDNFDGEGTGLRKEGEEGDTRRRRVREIEKLVAAADDFRRCLESLIIQNGGVVLSPSSSRFQFRPSSSSSSLPSREKTERKKKKKQEGQEEEGEEGQEEGEKANEEITSSSSSFSLGRSDRERTFCVREYLRSLLKADIILGNFAAAFTALRRLQAYLESASLLDQEREKEDQKKKKKIGTEEGENEEERKKKKKTNQPSEASSHHLSSSPLSKDLSSLLSYDTSYHSFFFSSSSSSHFSSLSFNRKALKGRASSRSGALNPLTYLGSISEDAVNYFAEHISSSSFFSSFSSSSECYLLDRRRLLSPLWLLCCLSEPRYLYNPNYSPFFHLHPFLHPAVLPLSSPPLSSSSSSRSSPLLQGEREEEEEGSAFGGDRKKMKIYLLGVTSRTRRVRRGDEQEEEEREEEEKKQEDRWLRGFGLCMDERDQEEEEEESETTSTCHEDFCGDSEREKKKKNSSLLFNGGGKKEKKTKNKQKEKKSSEEVRHVFDSCILRLVVAICGGEVVTLQDLQAWKTRRESRERERQAKSKEISMGKERNEEGEEDNDSEEEEEQVSCVVVVCSLRFLAECLSSAHRRGAPSQSLTPTSEYKPTSAQREEEKGGVEARKKEGEGERGDERTAGGVEEEEAKEEERKASLGSLYLYLYSSLRIPFVSFHWLVDCYRSGLLQQHDLGVYKVDLLSLFPALFSPKKSPSFLPSSPSPSSSSCLDVKRHSLHSMALRDCVIFLSVCVAVRTPELIEQCKAMQCTAVFVIPPILALCPWISDYLSIQSFSSASSSFSFSSSSPARDRPVSSLAPPLVEDRGKQTIQKKRRETEEKERRNFQTRKEEGEKGASDICSTPTTTTKDARVEDEEESKKTVASNSTKRRNREEGKGRGRGKRRGVSSSSSTRRRGRGKEIRSRRSGVCTPHDGGNSCGNVAEEEEEEEEEDEELKNEKEKNLSTERNSLYQNSDSIKVQATREVSSEIPEEILPNENSRKKKKTDRETKDKVATVCLGLPNEREDLDGKKGGDYDREGRRGGEEEESERMKKKKERNEEEHRLLHDLLQGLEVYFRHNDLSQALSYLTSLTSSPSPLVDGEDPRLVLVVSDEEIQAGLFNYTAYSLECFYTRLLLPSSSCYASNLLSTAPSSQKETSLLSTPPTGDTPHLSLLSSSLLVRVKREQDEEEESGPYKPKASLATPRHPTYPPTTSSSLLEMWGVKKPLIGVDMYLPVEWRVFAGTTRRRRREEEEERREGMIIVARPEWLLSCWAQKRFLPLDESRQILLPQHLLDGYVEEEFSPGEALSSSAGRAGSSRSVQHMLSQSQEEEEDQAELEEEEEGLSIQIGGDVAIFNDLPLTHAQRKKILKGNQIQRRQDAKKCCELYLDGSRRWRDLFPDVFAAPVVENDLEETDREM